ncbi:MAG TPA: DUF1015 domain-containing protein [Terriglobales bacterium]|nr:DUF1015 domain-containing protein [Terriglobales bacterium]
MADIAPFRALRYAKDRVSLGTVVTQPYDKITPSMQDGYYSASPYNLVRIILGKSQPEDSEGSNKYTRAADYLKTWYQDGVLAHDDQACLYRYSQNFCVPASALGQTGNKPVQLERIGFIAAGRIHDYAEGVVHRHEQTLAKPKSDRLNLLRATRAHFGQIFMLYSDPERSVETILDPSGTPPQASVTDEYGVLHRLWRISDTVTIRSVQQKMADKKLIIADGHHRYETALNYRNECRSASGTSDPNAPYERVMMTFVNMDSPGLVILPTHRVVFGLKSFEVPSFLHAAESYFDVITLEPSTSPQDALARLRREGESGVSLLVVAGRSMIILNARPKASDSLLQQYTPAQRQLDVVQVHKVILEKVLGLSEESIRNQENLNYIREAEHAVARVRNGEAQIAFLMNPCRIDQVRDIAFAGGVLPQKSTDFYPKLLSGLTIYSLDS